MNLEYLKQEGFIAILRHIAPENIADTAMALYQGGVRLFEVTFDPSSKTVYDTQKSIYTIRELYQDKVCIGAGTVLTTTHAKSAREAGAEFLVSPCTDLNMISYAAQNNMLSIPGAYTPNEILYAYENGADVVKIFPLLPHDTDYLKVITAPLSHIPFIPTGGINPDTIENYLNCGAAAVAAGATIVTNELIQQGNFAQITENARLHVEAVRRCRCTK